MLDVAYIFPGQGAQYVGMAEDIYRHYPQAQELFQRADSVLGLDLAALIFQGPIEKLTATANCQVAVFTTSAACLKVLEAERLDINVRFTAGLSLGEYTALMAAGVLSFEQALRLVSQRGQYMEEASRQHPGGMVSLIGLSLEATEELCAQAQVEVANLNCPGQIVVSGGFAELDKASKLALTLGAKKVIPLQVGGAFHSSLMASASQRLLKTLEEVELHPPKIAVISNVTAREESLPGEIKYNLAQQLVERTHWEKSVRLISSCGIKYFLEIGPGRVLKGLLRKIDPQLQVYNIEKIEDLENLKKKIRNI